MATRGTRVRTAADAVEMTADEYSTNSSTRVTRIARAASGAIVG